MKLMKRQLLIATPITLFCGTAGWFISRDWGFVAIIVAGCVVAWVAAYLQERRRGSA